MLHQQPNTGIECCFCQLNLADIILRHTNLNLPVMQDIDKGPIFRDNFRATLNQGTIDYAIGSNNASEIHLRNHFNNPRATDAGNLMVKIRVIRPDITANDLKAGK